MNRRALRLHENEKYQVLQLDKVAILLNTDLPPYRDAKSGKTVAEPTFLVLMPGLQARSVYQSDKVNNFTSTHIGSFVGAYVMIECVEPND